MRRSLECAARNERAARHNRFLPFLAAALYLLLAVAAQHQQQDRIAASVAAALRSAGRDSAALAALTRRPPMGYNDWNAVGCGVNERLILATGRAMVSRGLAAAGYRYVTIDDCWEAPSRDSRGRLQADPIRFPHGIPALARAVHALGLKFGIYADAGITTCAGYPGSFGHETLDARTFAAWGVDYLKEDWCSIPYRAFALYSHVQVAEVLAARMASALHATGRPIVLSLSNASNPALQMWRWGRDVAGLWRTTPDIYDSWASVLANLDGNTEARAGSEVAHWNDPDMLEIGNGGMTPAEERAHMSLWAIMAAPLMVGTNIVTMSRETATILTNRSVIAVDQDPLGLQGRVLKRSGEREALVKLLANGDRAVVLLNRGAPATRIAVRLAALGLRSGNHTVRDLWTGRVWRIGAVISVKVPARAAVMVRVH